MRDPIVWSLSEIKPPAGSRRNCLWKTKSPRQEGNKGTVFKREHAAAEETQLLLSPSYSPPHPHQSLHHLQIQAFTVAKKKKQLKDIPQEDPDAAGTFYEETSSWVIASSGRPPGLSCGCKVIDSKQSVRRCSADMKALGSSTEE